VHFREADRQVHLLVPAIGDRHQPWVERIAQSGDEIWQGIAEVFVLAAAKTVTGHHDPGAEGLRFRVKRADVITFCGAQQRPDNGAAILIELKLQSIPVECIERMLVKHVLTP